MREVKAQTLGSHQTALLLNVRSQHAAQSGVQQVGGRMVASNGCPTRLINVRVDRIAHAQGASNQLAVVNKRLALFLGVANRKHRTLVGLQGAGVAHLTTTFGVKRGVVQDHAPDFCGTQLFHRLTVFIK